MDDDAGGVRAARAYSQNKNGASMHYIIQILAAILVGTAVGGLMSRRDKILSIGSVVAIALGGVALVNGNWTLLVIGTAIFLLAQWTQRDPTPARA
jgi:chromate transport protein ChrA